MTERNGAARGAKSGGFRPGGLGGIPSGGFGGNPVRGVWGESPQTPRLPLYPEVWSSHHSGDPCPSGQEGYEYDDGEDAAASV